MTDATFSDAFSDILDANRSYAEHDFALAGIASTAARQLGVLTCIDTRIDPLAMLGLKAGDAKIFRNAGARITLDALRSLTLATHLLNVKRVMIVGHTNCAMNATPEQMHDKLVAAGAPDFDAPDAPFDLALATDPIATLVADVERLVSCPSIAPGVVVAGFRYDVDTGRITQCTEVRTSGADA